MKIKEGFLLRHVGKQIIVVALGDASRDFNGIIRLNETGEFLWSTLKEGCTEEELLEAMLKEYAIDRETASRDIKVFLTKLKEAKLLDE